MAGWKVLITDGLEESGKEVLRQAALVDDKAGITADDLLMTVDQFDALIVRGRTKVTPEVFAAASRLKVVGRAGVGVDNIDLAAARQRGVVVVNAPSATTIAVAELTMALMLAMVREVPRADAALKQNKWIKKELEGVELYGKTLGIIGFGRIGSSVGQRAAAFGMKVVVTDTLANTEDIRQRGAQPLPLDQLLAAADVLSIHTPLTNETRSLINAEMLGKMKRGVYIVCAARGGIIDEAALLAALDSGHVAGAALDVFASEPPGESALVNHPKVIATPHIGAQTVEAQQRAAADISSEVLAALYGDPLRWKVA